MSASTHYSTYYITPLPPPTEANMPMTCDPAHEMGDAFASWCEDMGYDPADWTYEDYLEWCADQDPRIGEDEYR